MSNKPFISVVIPAYNEAKRIGPTLESIKEHFSNKPYGWEIIVVNDGSPDDTAAVVGRHAASIPQLELIDNPYNRGKGYAVRCGMQAARGFWKLFMDADGSVRIDNIDSFLWHAQFGNDVVIGSIAHPGADSVTERAGWHRRIFSDLSKVFIRSLAVPGIYDTQRGFKLFSERAADVIFRKQTIFRFGFDIELLVIARMHGLRIKELPVEWDNPDGSTVTLRDYARTFRELMQIRHNRLTHAYN